VRIFRYITLILVNLFFGLFSNAQNDSIHIDIQLDAATQSLKIKQHVTYVNNSNDVLDRIYLHNWPNAFSDKNSHLGKRFVENYKKKFFFTNEKNRGFTKINNIAINYQTVDWIPKESADDYIAILLKKPLQSNQSVAIDLSYIVKVPHAKFTSYGCDNEIFNLRYWYLVPAVYDGKWQLMHHLDMDDLYQNPTNYTATVSLPDQYNLVTNLNAVKEDANTYRLQGNNQLDFELHLSKNSKFDYFQTDSIEIVTNLNNIELGSEVKADLVNRQVLFVQKFLGDYPHKRLFVNKTTYDKNPLYGFNQLPSFLRPFSDTFEWDVRMFKTLTKYYIDNKSNVHTRKNIWLNDGVQYYLMLKYVEKYYPDVKLIGGISKIWGIRSYHIATLDFNNRYDLTYQYAARRNHDQALNTNAAALTNFNRLIVNKYKAGMGLRYLGEYIGDDVVHTAIRDHFSSKLTSSTINNFKKNIESTTDKDVSWFFKDYIRTKNKIDYSLKKIHKSGDSIAVTIKNNRNFTAPIALYSIQNDSIQTKIWLTDIDSILTIKLRNDNSKRWMLNYEGITPEINLRNNWEYTNWSLLKRPLKIRLFRDAEDPNHTQLFVEPKYAYNFYDGFILATTLSNKTFLKKEFEYALTPSYGIKSNSLTGSFKTVYWKYPENKIVNSFRFGLVGSYYHYQPELVYKTLTPYAQIFFKRKNLRSVKSSSASINYAMINRDNDPLNPDNIAPNQYNIFSLSYGYSNPEIINNFKFSTSLEIGSKFSKISTDIRIRKLTNNKRQFSARLFAGIFLNNKTNSDFFSYGVNRPNDYLYRYRYLGRSETSGLLSQQIIINDGGFKADMSVPYADQWITSLSTSIGLWRWFEIYNDVGLAKNKGQKVFFIHDKGIRLNFVDSIFEIYFPLHSSNGWETTFPHYEERIRFVFTSDFKSISNFLKRGFM